MPPRHRGPYDARGGFALTTDNGATAVAETEVATQVSTETESQDTAVETQAVATDESAGTAEAASESAAAEEDVSFDFDSEVAAISPDASGDETAPQLPGRTAADIEYEAQTRDQVAINNLLREEQMPFQNLAQQYGLDASRSNELWVNGMRPLLQKAAGLTERGTNDRLIGDLTLALGQERMAKLFEGNRKYPGGRPELLKGAEQVIRAEVEAEWQGKVAKGEYLTKANAKKIADKAASVTEARVTKMHRDGTYQSGQNGATRGNGGKSDDDLLLDPNTPIKTVNEILARRSGQ